MEEIPETITLEETACVTVSKDEDNTPESQNVKADVASDVLNTEVLPSNAESENSCGDENEVSSESKTEKRTIIKGKKIKKKKPIGSHYCIYITAQLF